MTDRLDEMTCSNCAQASVPSYYGSQYRVSETRTDAGGPYERVYWFCSLACLWVATKDFFRHSRPIA